LETNDLRLELARLEGRLASLRDELQNCSQNLELLNSRENLLSQANELCKICLQESSYVKKELETLVSNGLQNIFGESYSFVFEEVKDKQGVLKGYNPKLSKNGAPLRSIDKFGAGISSTVDFIFRIAAILLSKESPNLLVADEVLADVNPNLWDNLGYWLEDLQSKTGLQIIIITHMPANHGTIFTVKQTSGISDIERRKSF
jgi:DNA repair exonuclease SbcCD ATPase subunit